MDGGMEVESLEDCGTPLHSQLGAASLPSKQAAAHPSPLVHIQFYDNDHSQGIYQLIEAYMLSLQPDPSAGELKQQVEAVSRDVVEENKEDIQGDAIMETAPPTTPTGDCLGEGEEPPGQVEYYVDYCVDRYAITYRTQVLFDQVYTEPFWVDPFVAREERRLRRMAIKCFNCGEDHHLNQCTEPRDVQRILHQSRLFKESLGTFGTDKRYHLCSNAERFSKFSPGQLSARLRQALSIGPTSLPPYINRMCVLGYPPGYSLQEKEQGLLFYHSPDTPETGDNINSKPKSRVIYPGFNDKDAVKSQPSRNPPDIKKRKEGAKKGGAKKTDMGDDLGTLSDYELEEMDGDDGEMVIGFCVKKSKVTDAEDSSESTTPTTQAHCFSLDFPPGLVDINADSAPSSQAWNSIKKVLSSKS